MKNNTILKLTSNKRADQKAAMKVHFAEEESLRDSTKKSSAAEALSVGSGDSNEGKAPSPHIAYKFVRANSVIRHSCIATKLVLLKTWLYSLASILMPYSTPDATV